MQILDRRSLLGTAAALISAASVGGSGAAELLRIVVPFPPGGPTDGIARLLAEELKAAKPGRSVIVENKPGAAGTIGVRAALAAPADGATLVVGNNQTHATAPFLIKDAGYDPLRDFVPIGGIATFPHVLIASKSSGTATVADLIERAKDDPGRLNFGSTGPGSGSHLAMELLLQQTGTRMQHVPYQGAAQMVGDIAAGRLDAALAILPSVLGAIDGNLVKALAVASEVRVPQLAHVPTLAEDGIHNAASTSWLALFVRAETSTEVAAALEGDLSRAMASERVRDGAVKLGATPMPLSGPRMRSFLASEIIRWGVVAKTAGLKPE